MGKQLTSTYTGVGCSNFNVYEIPKFVLDTHIICDVTYKL